MATIGVYGFTAETFTAALRGSGARLVAEVRQRRGVRGSEYAWANAVRLRALLAQAGIEYRHHPELAPTTELRLLHYRDDARRGVGKRSRAELAREYRERYIREILDRVELAVIAESLPSAGVSVLLCVARDAEACHRSIIAARMETRHGVSVSHILPPRHGAR